MISNDILNSTPVTDRGVVKPMLCINKGLNVNYKEIDMLFDWLQFTIQSVSVDDVLKKLFHVTTSACLHTPSGRFGYNNTFTYAEKIHIMYHDLRYEMGVHVLLSGSACRELENLFPWNELFSRILDFDLVKFTRIDVAIDCYKRYFDIPLLRQKIIDGELVSKFRQSTYIEQLNIEKGSPESASLKFGSMSSDIYIVFYDKLSERINAGYTVDDDIKYWVRCELRFKHDLAVKLAGLYIKNDCNLGDYIQSILFNYIDFKDWGQQHQKSRWDTSKFWIDFLQVVNKISIAPKAHQSTITKKKHYAEKQLSKTLAMLRIVENDFYNDLFKKGFKKISKLDIEIINAHLISQNITPIKLDDLKDIYANIINDKPALVQHNEIHEQIRLLGITV